MRRELVQVNGSELRGDDMIEAVRDSIEDAGHLAGDGAATRGAVMGLKRRSSFGRPVYIEQTDVAWRASQRRATTFAAARVHQTGSAQAAQHSAKK